MKLLPLRVVLLVLPLSAIADNLSLNRESSAHLTALHSPHIGAVAEVAEKILRDNPNHIITPKTLDLLVGLIPQVEFSVKPLPERIVEALGHHPGGWQGLRYEPIQPYSRDFPLYVIGDSSGDILGVAKVFPANQAEFAYQILSSQRVNGLGISGLSAPAILEGFLLQSAPQSEEGRQIVLLMQRAVGLQLSVALGRPEFNRNRSILAVAKRLADLHKATEGVPSPWLQQGIQERRNYDASSLEKALKRSELWDTLKTQGLLGDVEIATLKRSLANLTAAYAADRPTTGSFIHGDLHTANVFYDESADAVTFIDFSYSEWSILRKDASQQGIGDHSRDLGRLLGSVEMQLRWGGYDESTTEQVIALIDKNYNEQRGKGFVPRPVDQLFHRARFLCTALIENYKEIGHPELRSVMLRHLMALVAAYEK